ncbi:5-guanidino-2-oxopentanoate decarboxylase [Pseudoroseicyclus tamaricis]|uniref:5-guanidino-2-oxopentanoate decarboxylase n=1 Tax=Pseudoroseicyclus tamaricis TaxID=2705421 RepID=A0A6B2K1H4_9RHOB|nr:5-guanidino-2-oxopentanoate decarboxylase [Pseudoroseicyclus tamaricis]NDV00206.1 5-guanidino-2-oxopentanoate decarboxylase [Pseudoroseicyclus tamaricis]
MATIGEALIAALEERGVEVVFGIPGVHTVELYRGLAGSGIRHVTARHEQGAGFMADGYGRVAGRPGVALVITGPGVTNTLTPMGQARADSSPMLVISGVNDRASLGRGLGKLHELPDQRATAGSVALSSTRVSAPEELGPALDAAFAALATGRPGPHHIEIPLDVMPLPAAPASEPPLTPTPSLPPGLDAAARLLSAATRPVILAGGGARWAEGALREVAEALDAPVIQTVNARGLMHAHPLTVPASPSLDPVRALVRESDAVLAIGTEFGQTDYDMMVDGGWPAPPRLVRIDVSEAQLRRHPAEIALAGRAEELLPALAARLPASESRDGPRRAGKARAAARAALDAEMAACLAVLEAIRDALPGALIVGDSTQAVYAGNLYYDHDRPGGWFNAATGYGALGFAIPAAIGAALAAPGTPVVALNGDGGAQFSVAELMTAAEERLPITFIVWNNRAYLEIARAMEGAGTPAIGCHPLPPDFSHIAAACALPYRQTGADPADVAAALTELRREDGPTLLEIRSPV